MGDPGVRAASATTSSARTCSHPTTTAPCSICGRSSRARTSSNVLVGGRHRSARAHHYRASRRNGRGRRRRQRAAVRRADGLWRPARGVSRDARGVRPAGARPHHRRVGRRARQSGVPHGAADARAAHPAREGDLEHLHRAGAAGEHRGDVRRVPRARRADGDRPARRMPWRPRSRTAAKALGYRQQNESYFDTLRIQVPDGIGETTVGHQGDCRTRAVEFPVLRQPAHRHRARRNDDACATCGPSPECSRKPQEAGASHHRRRSGRAICRRRSRASRRS